VLQLVTANDPETKEDAYLEVIRSKTAALFAAAARIGAVVAERPTQEEEALRQYGEDLGIAFQLVDDYLDYSAKQAELGKTIGDDFREGKITLPIILAWEQGTAEERVFWRRTLEDLDQTDDDLQTAIHLMEKYGTLDATRARARTYADKAKAILAPFPDSEIKSAMQDLMDFVVERAY
jgi:octaprenyl-diphosphate synthase